MADRRDDAEHAGIGDEDIEFAPALENRCPERIDCVHVGKIKWHERRGTADSLDGVVELFKATDRAGASDHVRAGLGQFQRREIADASRRSGNEGDFVLKIYAHVALVRMH